MFTPHSHDAADSMDPALEASADGIHAVKISLVALLATSLAQAVVVVLTGSVALLADTIHNFSDALTAVPLWIAFVLGRRAASRRYTYGYGRAEDLAGVFIVAMIALSSIVAGYESVRRLFNPQPVSNIGVLIAAGLIGFAGNELVAVYRIRVGRRIGSAALVADGLHARTDGFTSLAVVLGALGVLAGYPLADPIIGVLITVAILVVLRGAARDIYRRLMDAVDPELVDTAEASLIAVPGVIAVEELRLRWIGHRVRAETGITVDPTLGIVAAHDIATTARTPCCTTCRNWWPRPCTSAHATPPDTITTPSSRTTPPRWNPAPSPDEHRPPPTDAAPAPTGLRAIGGWTPMRGRRLPFPARRARGTGRGCCSTGVGRQTQTPGQIHHPRLAVDPPMQDRHPHRIPNDRNNAAAGRSSDRTDSPKTSPRGDEGAHPGGAGTLSEYMQ